MNKFSKSKRIFLASVPGILVGYASLLFAKQDALFHATPQETPGPFYPVAGQEDKDYDLTQVSSKNSSAIGKAIWVEVQVLDVAGSPLKDTTVELWQANAAGRYNHPFDSNDAEIDPYFQGWAIVKTDDKGFVKFKTIFPGAYPASSNWVRPPHIHFKFSKQGYKELTTQMYFPGQPLNNKDRLLNSKSVQERELMIARKAIDAPETYQHQIVLA